MEQSDSRIAGWIIVGTFMFLSSVVFGVLCWIAVNVAHIPAIEANMRDMEEEMKFNLSSHAKRIDDNTGSIRILEIKNSELDARLRTLELAHRQK
jgi:hypothetical protein